ncbi:hypothetical protein [Novosphingobium pituita]|uniref:Uncharacterized protein n=1 Tax=Novosphingobium pituita TaxID=3056842 RepID=A0ABQ6P4T3_9SPHN|nr:hypothetical protein [Novosphingobium sp. IK01]GMM59870.1 hypothetical protein NUTIK01_06470 [Novosphingobium sp. IK01]
MILRKSPPKVPTLKEFTPKGPPPAQGYIPNGENGDTKTRRWAIEQSILLKGSKAEPASIIEMAEAIVAFVKGERR